MTFYTMVKSSSPIFVVASAYVFGIEKITPALILTVLIISAGELLTVMGEVAFDLIGFLLVLSASIFIWNEMDGGAVETAVLGAKIEEYHCCHADTFSLYVSFHVVLVVCTGETMDEIWQESWRQPPPTG
jgi:hypothetical protein